MLCGFQHFETGDGVPGVDRHGTQSAYRVGERCVKLRPVPAFTGPGPSRAPGVEATPLLARHYPHALPEAAGEPPAISSSAWPSKASTS